MPVVREEQEHLTGMRNPDRQRRLRDIRTRSNLRSMAIERNALRSMSAHRLADSMERLTAGLELIERSKSEAELLEAESMLLSAPNEKQGRLL